MYTLDDFNREIGYPFYVAQVADLLKNGKLPPLIVSSSLYKDLIKSGVDPVLVEIEKNDL